MTAPTYFEKDPDYTGFYLHHCVHYLDLVPWLMGEVEHLGVRAHELAPGKLVLHLDFRFVGGAAGTLVVGTNQSRGTPMEWWQVMADHQRVEVRNVHEVRHYRAPPFKVSRPDATLREGEDTMGGAEHDGGGQRGPQGLPRPDGRLPRRRPGARRSTLPTLPRSPRHASAGDDDRRAEAGRRKG